MSNIDRRNPLDTPQRADLIIVDFTKKKAAGEKPVIEAIDTDATITRLKNELDNARWQRACAQYSADADDMDWTGETRDTGYWADEIDDKKKQLRALGEDVPDLSEDSIECKLNALEASTQNDDILEIEAKQGSATCGDFYTASKIFLFKEDREVKLSGYTSYFTGSNRADGKLSMPSARQIIEKLKSHTGKEWDVGIIFRYTNEKNVELAFSVTIRTAKQAQNMIKLLEWSLLPQLVADNE